LTDFNSESKGAFYPKVSIVIPVFNGSDYLNEAIDSALAQTYKNIEIIVVNDGSSDEGKTEKMALAYGDKIRYLNKENGGVASALNLGIEEMNGEYFSWLSHDDLFYPKKTKIQVDELSKLSNKEVFVFSDFEFIDDKRQHINYFKVCEEFRDKFGLCIIFNQIHGCTVLIHKNILRAINGFDSRFQTTQDYNAWVNIFKMRFPSVHIQNVLVKSRIHNNQGTKTMKEISKSEILNIEKKYISEIAIYYPSYLNKIRLHYKAINYELHYLFLKFLLKSDYSLPTKLRVIFWIILIKLKIISSSIKRKNILKELSTKAYEKNLCGDSQSLSGPCSNL
jgi:glycosyltransferase involved in cell wall biosynthesis